LVDEDKDQDDEARKQEARKQLRDSEERKQRRQVLETRIGMTKSGHDWLRRIDRIGKMGRTKEDEGGEETSSPRRY
jgi:hypothetical protein